MSRVLDIWLVLARPADPPLADLGLFVRLAVPARSRRQALERVRRYCPGLRVLNAEKAPLARRSGGLGPDDFPRGSWTPAT